MTIERHDAHDAMLDEMYEPTVIMGMTFSASDILAKLDETAYRCAVLDYMNAYEEDDE